MSKKLTEKERVLRVVETYPELKDRDQKSITFKWNRRDGSHSQKVGTGPALKDSGYRNFIISLGVSSIPYMCAWYKYHSKYKIFEVSVVQISRLTPKENDNRRWHFRANERYFIPKGSKTLYDSNGKAITFYPVSILQEITRKMDFTGSFLEEFLKFTDNSPLLPPRFMSNYEGKLEYSPWILPIWFTSNPRVKTGNTPSENALKKCLDERPVMNIEDIMKEIPSDLKGKFAYYDKKANAIRLFLRGREGEAKESYRFYLSNKKIIKARFVNNKWEIITTRPSRWSCNMQIINYDTFRNSMNYFKYYDKIIETKQLYYRYSCGYQTSDIYPNVTTMEIYNAYLFPQIEQFANLGCYNIATFLSRTDTPKQVLKDMFGECTKDKSLLKSIGLTLEQLQFLDAHMVRNNYITMNGIISSMKNVLLTNTLRNIDMNMFEIMYNTLYSHNSYYFNNTFINTPSEGSKKAFLRLVKMKNNHAGEADPFTLFSDIKRMHSSLIRTDFEVGGDIMNFRNYQELMRNHDFILQQHQAYEEQCAEARRRSQAERDAMLEKQRAKVDKDRQKYNYEDDEYIIRLPENLSELSNEGRALHHCVGAYLNSHSIGDTTIMFLRKKNEPDKPFYTIEVSPQKIIRQIHGFGNKWLGNNPEAIPSVMKWLKACDIHCDTYILTSTSKSYSNRDAGHVALPQI